jgi:hypothetical protein
VSASGPALRTLARRALAPALGVLAALAGASAPRAAAPDSLATAVSVGPPSFDTVAREGFLRRHAFSLDHFLEFEPGGFVVRLGPIGNDALYSRWGIGRGRSRLLVNGIPLNDPQNDTAPFVHVATSGASTLGLGTPAARGAHAPWVEGSVLLDELEAPPSRPQTFVELAKGDNDVRSRRVRFASESGRAGLVLSYDEVLDDGYDFDTGELGENASDYGKSRSRNASIAVRGGSNDAARYSFGLRRYRSSTAGDLDAVDSEANRSGHLAWMDVGAAGASLVLYGRGFSSSYPDSASANETAGGALAWDAWRDERAVFSLSAAAEHTRATQDVGGAHAFDEVSRASLTLGAEAGRGTPTTWFADATAALDEQSAAWGAGAGVTRGVPHGELRASARRSFRLPSIGERHLPAHTRDGRVLSGAAGLDPEQALEARGDWVLRAGAWTNQVRAAWVRTEKAIAFRPVALDSLARRAANAGGEVSMTFVEERLRLVTALGRLEIRADAAALFTTGQREESFASVPRTQVNASFLAGSQLFEKSSALYAGVEYAFVDERTDFTGVGLPSFNVLNLVLEGRLIDARLYLRMLNVLDETYQTQAGYLMTPRTFAYGIEWTLFD